MSNNVAPDSWDNDVETEDQDPSTKFSSLNVNAVEFVPFIPKSNESDEKSSPSSDSASDNKLSVTNGEWNLITSQVQFTTQN